MSDQLELLRKKVAVLRSGGHNFQTVVLMTSSLQAEIEAKRVTWDQLEITAYELDELFYKVLLAEFLPLWKDYQSGKIKLERLNIYFPYLKVAISKGKVSFKDLETFTCGEFFHWQSILPKEPKEIQ